LDASAATFVLMQMKSQLDLLQKDLNSSNRDTVRVRGQINWT